MLKLRPETRVYVAECAVDFRKAIDGLSSIVMEQFEQPANSGSVFVFYNQLRDRVKCLYWDRNGFVLHQKRLERGRFKMKPKDDVQILTQQQLDWLLAGLDFELMHEFPELDYTNYF